MQPAQRGAVTLVFDDGYQAVFDRVLPLLRQHEVRAVFAVPVATDRLAREEGAPVSPLDDWKRACAEAGHELAAHGVTHRALPTLSDAELDRELEEAQRAAGATTLVYPGGAHDDRVVAVACRHFRAARTVRWGFETLLPRDRYRLKSFVARRDNFRVWRWNLRAFWALFTNRWLIETYHGVLPRQQKTGNCKLETGYDHYAVPIETFEAHLKFLARLPIRIATIRDIVHP